MAQNPKRFRGYAEMPRLQYQRLSSLSNSKPRLLISSWHLVGFLPKEYLLFDNTNQHFTGEALFEIYT